MNFNTAFLNQSQKGKNQWWRYAAFILIIVGLNIVSFVWIEDIADNLIDNAELKIEKSIQTILYSALEGFQFFVVLAGIFFSIKFIHKRSFSTLNYVYSFSAKEVLEGICIWGILLILGSLVNQQEQWKLFFDTKITVSLALSTAVLMISIGIQSYTEEVFFRGYLLQSLFLRIKNISLLILLSSSIFGLLHVADGLEAILGVTAFGAVFGIIVIDRNSLAFVSGVHFINNFFFDFLPSADENLAAEKNFTDFDLVTVAITFTQFILLLLYIKFRRKLLNATL